jgi:hypothetical protein
MKAVCHLKRLRSTSTGGISILGRPISADDLHPRMGLEPSNHGISFTIGEKVNGSMPLQITENGSIVASLAPGPAIQTKNPRHRGNRERGTTEQAYKVSRLAEHAKDSATRDAGLPPKAKANTRSSFV